LIPGQGLARIAAKSVHYSLAFFAAFCDKKMSGPFSRRIYMRSNSSSSATAPLPFEAEGSISADWKQEVAQRVAERRARQQQSVHVVDAREEAQNHAAADPERAARAAKIAASVAARYAGARTFAETPSAEQHDTSNSLQADASSPATEVASEPYGTVHHAERMETPAGADWASPAMQVDRTTAEEAAQPQAPAAPAMPDIFSEALIHPQESLPANLIPFPRELVAPRRARPRLADNPRTSDRSAARESRSTHDDEQGQVQLRIFEVEAPPMLDPSAIAEQSVVGESPLAGTMERAAWTQPSALCLDALAEDDSPEEASETAFDLPLPVASASSRAMALAVDFSLVTGAFFAFLFLFALSSPQLPTGKPAAILCAVIYGALWLLYQALFFSLSYATAGMHYARIAFCTMEDRNPDRKMLLRRIPAWWVSVLPLGLGFLWAAFDEDGLCWHDRISNLFLRSY
jgi:uncharacterized RDD family membrane protein YckC